MSTQLSEQAQNLLQLIPESDSIGNVTLRKKFYGPVGINLEANRTLDFAAAKTELLNNGRIKLGRGKGGSVRRATLGDANDYINLSGMPIPETGQVETNVETDTHTLEVATEEF